MALTRKMLKALGLSEEHIETIIEAHGDTVTALTNERDTYKADAEKLPGVQKELDDLKAAGDGGYKEKYEAEVTAHNAYKKQVESGLKRVALDAFLKEKVNIQRPEARALILDAVKYDDITVDDKNTIADADGALAKAYGEKYASFVSTESTHGAPPNNPPAGGGNTDLGKLDMASYIAARKKK